VIVINISLINK